MQPGNYQPSINRKPGNYQPSNFYTACELSTFKLLHSMWLINLPINIQSGNYKPSLIMYNQENYQPSN